MKQPILTIEQFRALAKKKKSASGNKQSKYKAVKTNGYDSEKEYNRAQQLKLMLRTGLISELREQVSFQLIPTQVNENGVTEKRIRYIADFVYRDNRTGKIIVEDTKGFRTPEYIIKRKLMLMVHGITIKEI